MVAPVPFPNPCKQRGSGEEEDRTEKNPSTHDHAVGETQVQWSNRIEELEVLVRKGDVQGFDILQEVLDFPSTNDGEDEGRLMEDIGDGNCETDRK
jgi:hypothetical protein